MDTDYQYDPWEYDHMTEPIALAHGEQRVLADQWDLSESTVSRWLQGQVNPNKRNLGLALLVRASARNVEAGRAFYLVRDKDNKLHAFLERPRRDLRLGKWFSPSERVTRNENFRCPFSEYLLPHRIRIHWDGEPLKVVLTVLS